MIKILFICHGSICRSPIAEFVMKDMVIRAGYTVAGINGATREDADFDIYSAATSREELGNPIYSPAKKTLAKHGIGTPDNELGVSQKRSRQITKDDYDYYDLLICADKNNVRNTLRIIGDDPEGKVKLLLDYAGRVGEEIADPWYTGDYDATWDDVVEGCEAMMRELIGIKRNGNDSVKELLKTVGPDYNNCLVNLTNSVLKKFGAETTANTLAVADEYLAKNYKNVVVLVLDALGVSILEKHLNKEGFFRSHIRHTYTSVYPPTTVAATTSILSGLYPNEHSWLGWDMYFPQIDKNVIVFQNREQMAEREGAEPTIGENVECQVWGKDTLLETKAAAEFDVASEFIPYTNILDKINAAHDDANAYAAMPYMEPYPDTLENILAYIKKLCDEPGEKFIYSYWNEPDSTMHETGTMSDETHEVVTSIEKTLEQFSSELSETLLFITADHGHMDCNNICILDYPEVMNCLVRMPSFEPRTLNLFVKDEYMEDFPEIFKKNFGDDFLLLTREQVLEEKLFGPGVNREGLGDMIGDFVALATSAAAIFNTHYEMQKMPGGHAGLTVEEMQIPLIVVEPKAL